MCLSTSYSSDFLADRWPCDVYPYLATPAPASAVLTLKSDVVSTIESSEVRCLKPAAFNAAETSALDMNVFQTNPLREFSAMRTIGPTSIPNTSGLYHPVAGLNASTNPYFTYALSPHFDFMFSSVSRQILGSKAMLPPAAVGTTLPSTSPCCGGPPQAV